jgi:hypothetical protein
VPLPLIADGPRLWKRVTETVPSSAPLDHAVRRFRALFVERNADALRVLDEYCSDPLAVRRVYLRELDRYHSLNQRGASALIRAVCNVDGDLTRAIDWACGPRDTTAPGDPCHERTMSRFTPEELLETLCGSFISVPLHERESLDMFTPPRDSLTNIEEIFGQLILMMSGMPAKFENSKLIIRKLQSTSLACRRLLKGA